jgi:transcription-repair coupling factor (superfamily II helicase)
MPEEVKNILYVAELKVIGRKLKLYEIAATQTRLAMTWDETVPQDIMRKIAAKYKKIHKPLPNRIEFDYSSRKEITEMLL